MKFINRTTELGELERRFKSGKPELFIIYGKRRVGKTELVKAFIKKKHAVYFLADKRSSNEQFKEFSRLVAAEFKDPLLEHRPFADWIEVFIYLKQRVKKRFVLVIDEYPYLTEVDRATSTIFQKGWDEYLKASNICVVLLGSSVSLMESEILIQTAPLFGRRSGQLLLQPLSFLESAKFYPSFSFGRFLEIFTVTGGMPAYLSELIGSKSARQALVERVFPPTVFLRNEVEFVLKEELREPKTYLSILRAIALGKRKLSEIINEVGMEKASANKYLHVLERLKLVQRELPVTENYPEKSRKGLYAIRDNFFRFWFRFVFPYNSDLEIGQYEAVLKKFPEQFRFQVGYVYEDVCRELVWLWQKKLFSFERVGKWWEKNEEIDVVGLNGQSREILFGECKWSDRPVGTNIYVDLKRKAFLVDWHKNNRKEYYILFSKSGFTPDMKKLAKKEKVFLVEQNKLLV